MILFEYIETKLLRLSMSGHRRVKDVAYEAHDIEDVYDDGYDDSEGR